ncbi:hypothetical protein Tco_0126435 [Tanacetum coccineum]
MCLLKIPQRRASDLESKFVLVFVEAAKHLEGSPAGIHGLFSGRYCGLAGRMVTLRVSTAGAKGVTTGTLDFTAAPAILITKASQSRQHSKTESDLTSHLLQSLFDVGFGRISIVIVNTFRHHSDVLAIS